MRIIRGFLQVVVFLFFALYLLALETGQKVRLPDFSQVFQIQQRDVASPKPSPIERMRSDYKVPIESNRQGPARHSTNLSYSNKNSCFSSLYRPQKLCHRLLQSCQQLWQGSKTSNEAKLAHCQEVPPSSIHRQAATAESGPGTLISSCGA